MKEKASPRKSCRKNLETCVLYLILGIKLVHKIKKTKQNTRNSDMLTNSSQMMKEIAIVNTASSMSGWE